MSTVFVITPEHVAYIVVFALLITAAVVHGLGMAVFNVARKMRRALEKLFKK